MTQFQVLFTHKLEETPKDLAKASNKGQKPQKATKQPQAIEIDEQAVDNKEKQDITATKSTVDPWATWKNKNN